LALLYVIHHIKDKVLVERASKMLIPVSAVFLIFFLTFVYKILTISGFAVESELSIVNMESYKYLNNLISNHFSHFLFVSGTLLVLT